MIYIFKSKFSVWDLFGILAASNVIMGDITLWPIVAILGFLWLFLGRCMERLT